jgi:SAM-dependent methyltransferase
MSTDSTQRFSNRVEDYVKYRPHYPAGIISFLQQKYGLAKDKVVADIGAGTGISTELFLKAGCMTFAIEPNKAMREKAIALLEHYPGFWGMDGTAEHTFLPDQSVDFIIAGQAFHWFDPARAKTEFKRILKKNAVVGLLWNERNTRSDFEQEYDQLIIRHGKDYVQVDHRNIDKEHITDFYAPARVQLDIFPNKQVFDLEGLKGRLLSSSYMPTQLEPGYEDMVNDLQGLFNRHQQKGVIEISYDTKLYTGKLK